MRTVLCFLLAIISLFSFPVFAEEAAKSAFALNTTGFLDENMIPVVYTCDGKDISPELSWSDAPQKTQSFTIILNDPDAPDGNFYHWIVYNIPKTVAKLDEGMQKLPSGTALGKNNFGDAGYNGPCPPKGSSHAYMYTLYALDAKLNLPANADGKAVEKAMENHILETKKLTAVYSRWIN